MCQLECTRVSVIVLHCPLVKLLLAVMGGLKWKSNVLVTAFFVPGYVAILPVK